MIKNSTLLKLLRCKLIIEELEKGYYPSLTALTNKINHWLESVHLFDGDIKTDISKRTVKRDIAEIRQLFNINIEHSKTQNGYLINGSTLDSNHIHTLLDNLHLFFIQKNAPDANKHIRFAPRQASGSELFFIILKATNDQKKVAFTYSQYEKQEVSQRLVSPLGLKEFKGFWYLVASENKGIKTFGLDRISGLSVSLENAFIPEYFDLDEYYEHCYGIVRLPNDEPLDIIIKTTHIKAAYYKANPLHHSQRIIEETNEYTIFSLYMYLTYDLQQELRSHGVDQVEVLKPKRALDGERYF